MTPTLTALATDIQAALTGALYRSFEHGSFGISFDHETIEKLNDALEPIGFSVYGMSYTEDATCITLQLSNDMTESCGNNLFHYCQFSFNSDGDFTVELDEDVLDNGLSVRLTTPHDQHMFNNATQAEIDAAANNLQMALQTRLLKV
jgi:hypothetical protein